MKLYAGRIKAISEEVVRDLQDSGAIEVMPESVPEAELDVQGVMFEYNRMDRELSNRARELSDQGRGPFGRIKRQLAAQNNFKTGEEGLDYMVNQLIEMFLHSHHIDEIYADDLELRLAISKIMKKHTEEIEGQLDEKVRNRIKNLNEGSVAWDDEYERVMRRLKKEQKLE